MADGQLLFQALQWNQTTSYYVGKFSICRGQYLEYLVLEGSLIEVKVHSFPNYYNIYMNKR